MEFILYINRIIMRHKKCVIRNLELLVMHVDGSLARKGRNSIFTDAVIASLHTVKQDVHLRHASEVP